MKHSWFTRRGHLLLHTQLSPSKLGRHMGEGPTAARWGCWKRSPRPKEARVAAWCKSAQCKMQMQEGKRPQRHEQSLLPSAFSLF